MSGLYFVAMAETREVRAFVCQQHVDLVAKHIIVGNDDVVLEHQDVCVVRHSAHPHTSFGSLLKYTKR